MMFVISLVGVVLLLFAFIGCKLWLAHREIEHVLSVNADLTQKNQQQRADILVKEAQIQNHQTRGKHEENISGSSRERIVEQLHANGDLRD